MKKRSLIFVFLSILFIVPEQIVAQSEYYITGADETELYVQEYGEGNPVVLLSGGPLLSINYLKGIWENLNHQFRWILLHQRGTGKSLIDDPDSTSFSLKNYVNDLEALRNELEVDQLTLIGHSWGGMLAMEYAAQHPKEVQKMVLLASGGPTSNFLQYFRDNINMRLHDSDREKLEELGRQNKDAMPVAFPGYFYDRERALQIREKTDFEKWYGQLQFSPFVTKNYMAATKERVKGLKNYNGPVELIQGRQDPIGESTAYEIKEIMPQTEISFIERAGHFPWLENEPQAEEFFKLLNQALKD